MPRLIEWLREPSLNGMDIDGLDRIERHRSIIRGKLLLRSVFGELHSLMLGLEERHLTGEGLRLEIGAAAWPLRETDPSVLATDVVPAAHLDRVLDAQSMDLSDSSMRAIFGQHCFHHLPEPRRFFAELERVLVPGGGAILVEPYWSPAAHLLFPVSS